MTVFPELVDGTAFTDVQPLKLLAVPQQKLLSALVEFAITLPFKFAFVPAIPVATMVVTVGAAPEAVKLLISPHAYLLEDRFT